MNFCDSKRSKNLENIGKIEGMKKFKRNIEDGIFDRY